jgi:AraC-like DNA-binding protein/quercetin dioxygenase-like cupin family protein
MPVEYSLQIRVSSGNPVIFSGIRVKSAMQHVHDRKEWTGSKGVFLVERHTARAMAAAHWHDHVELNLLLEGRMTYLFNGKQEQVKAGRLVLFWAAIPHQTITVTENAPLVCVYLPLADFLAMPLERKDRKSIMQGQFLAEGAEETADMLLVPRWEREWVAGSPARQRLIADEVKVRVRRLILDSIATGRTLPFKSPTPSAGAAVRHVENLTDLISAHFATALSIPDLAGLAKVHASTANKAFRDVLGLSVHEYLTRYRIARAMQLLTDTDAPVLQIGFDCGFGSSSGFYEIFKAQTGTTPRQFRESIGLIGASKPGDGRMPDGV